MLPPGIDDLRAYCKVRIAFVEEEEEEEIDMDAGQKRVEVVDSGASESLSEQSAAIIEGGEGSKLVVKRIELAVGKVLEKLEKQSCKYFCVWSLF